MAFHILPVSQPELPLLRALAEHTFRDAWEKFNDPKRFAVYCDQAFKPETFLAEWQHPGSEFFMTWFNEMPVAYIKLNFDRTPPDLAPGPTVQIERLYVLPEYQSQRLGEKLLELAENRSRQTNAQWLWLSVWKEAPRAQAFYTRHGFERFGEEIFWVDDDPQEDWLVRRKVPFGGI